MNKKISLSKESLEFLKWSKKNSIGKIPKGVAKEGAGENRIPFAHLANSVPVYLTLKKVILKSDFKKANVLDVGCGTGRNISFVKESVNRLEYKYFGIDYSAHCVNFARNQYKKQNVIFVQHEGKILPFPDESFDFIVSSHVLEHIPVGDVNLYFSELSRILKKNGTLVIGTPNRKYCQDLFAINSKETRKFRLILPHLHEYYFDELKKLFKKGKWFSKFTINQTINNINRNLMINSINKIKFKNDFLNRTKFEIYSKVREVRWLQDVMARLGTEYMLKKMKFNYKQLIDATYFIEEPKNDEGENFIVIAKK